MTHDPKRFTFSYTFTQPYNVSMNPLYQDQVTLNELQRLDDIDRAVQNMLTYPDAERIINKLKGNNEA